MGRRQPRPHVRVKDADNATPQQQVATSSSDSDSSGDDLVSPGAAVPTADVAAAVRAAIKQALPPAPTPYSAEVLGELITGEVIQQTSAGGGAAAPESNGTADAADPSSSSSHTAAVNATATGGGTGSRRAPGPDGSGPQQPWASADAARAAFGEAVADLYPSADEDDLASFFEVLSRRLRAVVEASEAAACAAAEAEAEGRCALCERHMLLTFHHLIPRDVHSRYKRRGGGGLSQEQLNAGVWVCRPCHSAVHRTEDNATLAQRYSTLEALRAHPEVAKFAAWAARQRVGGQSAHDGLRHAR